VLVLLTIWPANLGPIAHTPLHFPSPLCIPFVFHTTLPSFHLRSFFHFTSQNVLHTRTFDHPSHHYTPIPHSPTSPSLHHPTFLIFLLHPLFLYPPSHQLPGLFSLFARHIHFNTILSLLSLTFTTFSHSFPILHHPNKRIFNNQLPTTLQQYLLRITLNSSSVPTPFYSPLPSADPILLFGFATTLFRLSQQFLAPPFYYRIFFTF